MLASSFPHSMAEVKVRAQPRVPPVQGWLLPARIQADPSRAVLGLSDKDPLLTRKLKTTAVSIERAPPRAAARTLTWPEREGQRTDVQLCGPAEATSCTASKHAL